MAAIFYPYLLMAIGQFLIIRDPLQHSDVIHVIAGEDYRTDYAIRLYLQGYADYLFFTGGWCEEHQWEHGAHARQLAISQGVSPLAIGVDDSPVMNTYSEVMNLKKWIEANQGDIHSIMVVSDPYHMRRARWTYRFVLGGEYTIRMAPVPMEQTPFLEEWWKDAVTADFVTEEYIKLFYYLLRYGLSIHWLEIFDTE
ncbi:MAG: YdcF family protein [Chloroflexota bacterium]